MKEIIELEHYSIDFGKGDNITRARRNALNGAAMEMRENPFKLDPVDENLKNPVLFLKGQYPQKMTIWAKLRKPPHLFSTYLGNNFKVMRFSPADIFTDMFIWITGRGQNLGSRYQFQISNSYFQVQIPGH